MRDHLGRFFGIMAETRCEYIDIGFSFFEKGRASEWNFVAHSRADGIAGLHLFLRKHGYEARPAKPQLVRPKPPFFAWPWLLVKSLANKGPYAFAAAARPQKLADRFQGNHTPVAESSLVFSVRETQKICAAAAELGVSVNSYLLAHLHAILYRELTDQKGPQIWLVPVDLRPWLGSVEDINLFSMLFLGLGAETTPATVHATMHEMLGSQRHWHFWLQVRLASRLGLFERLRKRHRKTEFHFGEGKKLSFIFSNLGAWNVNPAWATVMFSPPPNISAPLAIGAVTTNGQLALTLRVHPALALRSADLARLMKKIRKALVG